MKEKPPHILNASSNLLGFCFFIIATIRTLAVPDSTLIDDAASITLLLLSASVFLSFLAIRGAGEKSERYELYADYFFLAAVSLIFIVGILLFFTFII